VAFVSDGESITTRCFQRTQRQLVEWLTATLWLISTAAGVSADELSVQVGFERCFKVGQWTPILVDGVVPNARTCEVVAIDSDGVRVAQPLHKHSSAEAARWSGVFRSGRLDGEIEVRVWIDDAEPVQRMKLIPSRFQRDRESSAATNCVPLRHSQPLWLEVGTPQGSELLSSVDALLAMKSEQWPEAAEAPWALDGVDGIWVTSRTVLSEPARVELTRWLRRGGHVALTIAGDSEEFQRTVWAKLFRDVVEAHERTRTNDLSGVESFAIQAHKILGANRTPVTILAPQTGRVLFSCLDGPLATRASFGYGQVTVLGIDATAPPLARWNGRDSLLKRLLIPLVEKEGAKSAARTSLSQSGITDLASQWRAAVIQMPEIDRPSLWGALGLLLAYAAVIGPLDYLIVHKMLKRPAWTWATLPILVGLASAGTVWLAHAANGDVVRLTQLDVLDINAENQEVTNRSWITTYSTENRVWKIDAAARMRSAKHPQRTLSWLGFPENASGGLYRESGFDLSHALARSADDRSALASVPLRQWSSKSLTSDMLWIPDSPLVESTLTSTSAAELGGGIVHHLPFVLQDWIIVFEKWVYYPHPKQGEPATRWPADDLWTPKDERNYGRELRGFLTRTTATKRLSKKGVVSEDVLVEQERYNPLNLDPAEILQMMTLHESAGGKGYTGLDHHSLRAFDFSPLLALDCAVVIARIAEPTTAWRFDDRQRAPSRHHGFVRILLPVKRIGDQTGFRALPKFEPPPAVPKAKDSSANETKSP
jgi:hypothetical protein